MDDIAMNNPVDPDTTGTHLITYDVMDSSGNPAATAPCTVNVVNTQPPEIKVTGDNPTILEVGTPYVNAGATAADNYNGDISSTIVVTGEVNANVVGTYTTSKSRLALKAV